MKKIYILITILFISSFAFSQQGSWLWASGAGGNSTDFGESVAVDASGNVVSVGSFRSATIMFGSNTLTAAGETDVYISKTTSTGIAMWSRRIGAAMFDYGKAVATDNNDNIFVAGYFQSPSILIGANVLTNGGSNSMFITKYNSVGTPQWAKTVTSGGFSQATKVATDINGNVIVAGIFYNTISFGATTLTASGDADIFIVKYNNAGTFLWGRSGGAVMTDQVSDIATDAFGNIFVTGNANMPSISFGLLTLSNAGTNNIFILKMDANGNPNWLKGAFSNNYDNAASVSTDAAGDVYLTGNFTSTMISFGVTTLNNMAGTDMYVAKLDSAGSEIFAFSIPGLSGMRINAEPAGDFYVTGLFYDTTVTFGTTTLHNTGTPDMFVAKYNSTGTIVDWSAGAGGSNYEYPFGSAIDGNGSIYITGYYASTYIAFDADTVFNMGGYNIFLAKVNGPSGTVNTGSLADANGNIIVSPNPTTGAFQITDYRFQISNVKIMNVFGQLVYCTSSPSGRSGGASIDLREFEKGIYFLEITTVDGEKINKKIIKQ